MWYSDPVAGTAVSVVPKTARPCLVPTPWPSSALATSLVVCEDGMMQQEPELCPPRLNTPLGDDVADAATAASELA